MLLLQNLPEWERDHQSLFGDLGKGSPLRGSGLASGETDLLQYSYKQRKKFFLIAEGGAPRYKRADLRGRGFLLLTSARGARADCWGRVGNRDFQGAAGCGFPPPPLSTPHAQATVSLCGAARAPSGRESRDRWGGVEEGGG